MIAALHLAAISLLLYGSRPILAAEARLTVGAHVHNVQFAAASAEGGESP